MSRKTTATVFHGIDELYTLKDASLKKARNVEQKDLSIVAKAAMVCLKGKIIWVGAKKSLPKEFVRNSSEKDLKASMVMPGFVECHTHSIFAGNRNNEFEWRNQGVSYQEIAAKGGGILSTVRATRKASNKNLLQLLESRVERFISQGVTTLEVKTGYGLSEKSEIKMLKIIRAIKDIHVIPTFLGAHSVPPEFSSAEKYLDHLTKLLPKIKKLADRVDIFVESGFFSKELAQRYLDEAQRLGFKITIHADQLTLSGGSDLALNINALSADHLLQIDQKIIEKLSRSEVTCVLLPAADFFMKMKYPEARKLIDGGARVALSTDFNPGTAPSQSLSLVWWLARLEMKMTLAEIIIAQTLGGAYALGLEDQVGSLGVGKCANFVCLDGDYQVTQTFFKQKRVFSIKS